ncbi:MAG: growth inhibitor PemK [Methylococcales bacterium]
MPFPQPVPGLVIRYAYVEAEHQRGRIEGVKDRPCAVVLVTMEDDGDQIVTVLPVTHSPPTNPALAIEIPRLTRQRLGLDDESSWIVLSEANRFVWPGPDLRPAHTGDSNSMAHALLPRALFKEITAKLAAAITARFVRVVPRTK